MVEETLLEAGEKEQTPEYSEAEQAAIDMGWNPEGVEGKPNLSAEEFIGRKPLYDDIRALKRSQKKLQDSFQTLHDHHSTMRAKEREQYSTRLKQAKAAALAEDNYEAVVEIDEKLAEQRDAAANEQNPPDTAAFDTWAEDNPWYDENKEMQEYANLVGAGYDANNPNAPIEKVYAFVAEEVKKRFAGEFKNERRSESQSVEGSQRSGGSSKSRARDLPDQDYSIMKKITATGVMSEKEWLDEYYG